MDYLGENNKTYSDVVVLQFQVGFQERKTSTVYRALSDSHVANLWMTLQGVLIFFSFFSGHGQFGCREKKFK